MTVVSFEGTDTHNDMMDDDDKNTLRISPSSVSSEEKRLLAAAREHMARKAQQSSTHKLTEEDQKLIPLPLSYAFGLRIGAAESYKLLPASLKDTDVDPSLPRWRIELHGLVGSGPVGLDICGDAALGRSNDRKNMPDFDLDPYNAANLGVSRRHALLRPTKQKLYLIDLQSMNGTRCNAVLIGNGQAYALNNNDTVTLGNLTFQVKIIDSPLMERPKGE